MKVIPFTLPGVHDKTVNVVHYSDTHFYSHLHVHKEYQLMWIREGEGTLIVDHNIFPFDKGNIFLIGPNQPHVFKNDSVYFHAHPAKKVKGLSLFFNPNENLKPLLSVKELKPIGDFLYRNKNGFKVPQSHQAGISQNMLLINNSESAELISNLLLLFQRLLGISNLLIPLSEGENNHSYSEEKGKRIQKIYDYVLENFQNTIKLDEIAQQANYTTPAFCRYFKKHTGKTFTQFLNELRVNEVCKLLIEERENLSISEIAYKCGFNSITNFNRIFKTIMGCSPMKYRKQYFNSLKE